MGFLKKLFKSDTKPVVTVVSGLPRSGTSMMMKMLDAGGISPVQDGIRTADTDNPKGYYEFERVKQLDKGDKAWVADAQGKAVKVISALLKHLPDDYQYRVIFVRRNMPEILASQRKMLVRRGEDADKMDDAQMAALFEKHVADVERWLAQQPNMQTLYVHYSEVLADPLSHIAKINAFCGGALNEEAMASVVDPDLYRNRAGGKNN
ncbi:MAG: sulfotransferase [Ardenticatenaceae bacterium]|nr:sulfotransferase [Anaerolineales bacterium]MCB8922228.1 sulfotransferase [Ardenticatenaceae bacterium]MCB8990587.1 sulfotransferase [Ardenticatenaceae bacterium]